MLAIISCNRGRFAETTPSPEPDCHGNTLLEVRNPFPYDIDVYVGNTFIDEVAPGATVRFPNRSAKGALWKQHANGPGQSDNLHGTTSSDRMVQVFSTVCE